jgi:hypothetical protein
MGGWSLSVSSVTNRLPIQLGVDLLPARTGLVLAMETVTLTVTAGGMGELANVQRC